MKKFLKVLLSLLLVFSVSNISFARKKVVKRSASSASGLVSKSKSKSKSSASSKSSKKASSTSKKSKSSKKDKKDKDKDKDKDNSEDENQIPENEQCMIDNMETLLNGEFGVLDMLVTTSILPSKSEARRMVEQNGVSINNEKVKDKDIILNKSILNENSLLIQKGKKKFIKLLFK